MDTITQGILGAAVGHAVLGRRLGGKAMAIGFVGGIVPDLDIFLARDERSLDFWYYHRGITHSLFFGPVAGLAFAAVSRGVERWRSGAAAPFGLWYLFWVLVLVTHVLLDLATQWGTAIFTPFSNARYGLPAVPVIDPVYTLILAAALILAFVKGTTSRPARHLVLASLVLSTLYVGMSYGQNLRAERLARADLAAAGIEAGKVHAYTTMFSPWLRRVVAVSDDAHRVGFVSTLRPRPIAWTEIPRDLDAEALIKALDGTREGRIYRDFANGPINAVRLPHAGNPADGSELRLYDLRFGFANASIGGSWGMAAILDAEGSFVSAERFTVPRDISRGDLLAFLRATLGLEPRPTT